MNTTFVLNPGSGSLHNKGWHPDAQSKREIKLLGQNTGTVPAGVHRVQVVQGHVNTGSHEYTLSGLYSTRTKRYTGVVKDPLAGHKTVGEFSFPALGKARYIDTILVCEGKSFDARVYIKTSKDGVDYLGFDLPKVKRSKAQAWA